MKKLAFTMAAVLSMVAVPVAANAAACRDSKGHFIKCAGAAPAPAATHAAVAAHPAVHATPAASSRKPQCRDAKGRFKKC